MAKSYTDAEIEGALYRNFGNVTMAAIELGANPRTLRRRINGEDREKFAACRFESDERIKDLAEAGAYQHVLNGSESMIRFTLARKAQDRGWAQKQELSGPGGLPIQIASEPTVHAIGMPDDERELLRELLERQRARMLSGG